MQWIILDLVQMISSRPGEFMTISTPEGGMLTRYVVIDGETIPIIA